MPDVGAALRGRTFGIPNGLLLVAVAAGIWWFFIRGKTGAKATPQAAAAGSQLESGYGLGFAQGQQAAQANAPPAAATDHLGMPQAPVFWRNPITGQIYLINAQGKRYISASEWASIQQSYGGNAPFTNVDPAQLNALPNAAGTGAQGGGAPIRKHHIGSRSSNLMHDAHPLIGAPVKYAHYVRVGGPRTAAAHHANVHNVAAQAGVHPARVAMLNPVPTGLIRIA